MPTSSYLVSDPQEAIRAVAAHPREVALVDLPVRRGTGARTVIGQMGRLARDLPDRVAVVVVSIASVESMTVETLIGLSVSRRCLAVRGRHLVLRVPGEPTTRSAAALLSTMSVVRDSEPIPSL